MQRSAVTFLGVRFRGCIVELVQGECDHLVGFGRQTAFPHYNADSELPEAISDLTKNIAVYEGV